MSIERKLIGTTDAATSSAVYVEDVFNTWVYSGTNATQTITNGIDLATKGGLVWIKQRSGTQDHTLFDTARGVNNYLRTNTNSAQNPGGSYSDLLTAFGVSGFSLGADASTVGFVNASGSTYASWTFAKQPKFFDIVTYTGTGSARTISHALGAVPGMIIVKRTDTTNNNWQVYHRSLTSAANSIQLNLTAAQASATTVWNSTAPTSSVFSVGTDATVNASGGTYVAYLFAHDAGGFGPAGTDSVVACGSFTAGNATVDINLGWEPQFVIVKASSTTSNWFIADSMRGMTADATGARLFANGNFAEDGAGATGSSSTGFRSRGSVFADGTTCIYLAIRRGPMRTPTDATKVFSPNAVNVATGTKITTGFPVDLQIYRPQRSSPGDYVYDRLRGVSTNATDTGAALIITSTAAEAASSTFPYTAFWDNTGYRQDAGWQNTSNIAWNFRRAPGFFDVVCYTGNVTSNVSVNHSLGVAPEMVIMKQRDGNRDWLTWHYAAPSNSYAINRTDGPFSNQFNSSPTSTQVVLNAFSGANQSGNYVMYLFATCPGVSKVGSYTGNGSSQTIDCGFASGARFVLIKRTDSTGDWYVWDSSRGIVSGNDPRLSLNTTAAEVTTDDSIDPASSGFIVNQLSATNINVSGASYVFLSVA